MVPLVCVVVLFWLGVFYVALAAQGISAADFLWGRRVPLPTHLGRWVDVGVGVDGRMRQERRLLPGGQGDPSCLILQVRFLDPKTGEIVAVLPEQREERRRSRSSR
jgi:hypothetical protein